MLILILVLCVHIFILPSSLETMLSSKKWIENIATKISRLWLHICDPKIHFFLFLQILSSDFQAKLNSSSKIRFEHSRSVILTLLISQDTRLVHKPMRVRCHDRSIMLRRQDDGASSTMSSKPRYNDEIVSCLAPLKSSWWHVSKEMVISDDERGTSKKYLSLLMTIYN